MLSCCMIAVTASLCFKILVLLDYNWDSNKAVNLFLGQIPTAH
jgi:hypothetical protein